MSELRAAAAGHVAYTSASLLFVVFILGSGGSNGGICLENGVHKKKSSQ